MYTYLFLVHINWKVFPLASAATTPVEELWQPIGLSNLCRYIRGWSLDVVRHPYSPGLGIVTLKTSWVVYYLSTWYTRAELASRIGIIVSAEVYHCARGKHGHICNGDGDILYLLHGGWDSRMEEGIAPRVARQCMSSRESPLNKGPESQISAISEQMYVNAVDGVMLSRIWLYALPRLICDDYEHQSLHDISFFFVHSRYCDLLNSVLI